MVQDLCHSTEGRLLSHMEFQEKHGLKSTFLEMLAIRLSIPIQCRQVLSKDWVLPPIFPEGPLLQIMEQETEDIRNLSSKKTYSLLLSAKRVECVALHRWSGDRYPDPVRDREEWSRICKRADVTTKETKLQSLQFKILHTITPCRKYLRQIRIMEDEHCPQCGQVDDITHFFFLCPGVQTFWISIVRWLENQVNIKLDHITPKEAILGIDDLSSAGKVVNLILLHLRFYVHRQRLFHDSKFELVHWLAELRLRLRCFKNNLQLECKMERFRS